MRRHGITAGGILTASLASAVFLVPGGLWVAGFQPPVLARATPPPPAISIIQTMSELATTRVHVSDFIEGEGSGYRAKWTLHGEVVLGVDLSQAAYVSVRPEAKEAVLRLPLPRMLSSKVDHDRSEELYMKSKGWDWGWLGDPQVLRAEVWRQADRKIQRLGQEPAHVQRARVQAEAALRQLFIGVGYNVRFEWEDGPSPAGR